MELLHSPPWYPLCLTMPPVEGGVCERHSHWSTHFTRAVVLLTGARVDGLELLHRGRGARAARLAAAPVIPAQVMQPPRLSRTHSVAYITALTPSRTLLRDFYFLCILCWTLCACVPCACRWQPADDVATLRKSMYYRTNMLRKNTIPLDKYGSPIAGGYGLKMRRMMQALDSRKAADEATSMMSFETWYR